MVILHLLIFTAHYSHASFPHGGEGGGDHIMQEHMHYMGSIKSWLKAYFQTLKAHSKGPCYTYGGWK